MRLRDGVTAIAGLAAVATSVLVIGGAFRWTQAIVAVLVAIAVGAQLSSRRALGRPSPLVVVLGIAAALTALQLVPLGALVDLLNPTGSALRDDGAALLGTSPWQAASLDAPGSLRALTFFVIVLGVALVALRMAVSEKGRYRLLASIAVLCGVTAGIVWLHELFGAVAVYGIYEPAHASPHLRGPLLNLNHLGCLMAVGTVLALGLVMHRRQATWLRIVWVAVMAGCGALTVATVSRGATLALVVGVLVVGVVLVGQRLAGSDGGGRRRGDLLTKSLPIGIVAICAVVVVIYSSAGGVERELGRMSMSELQRSRTKFAAWKSTVHLVEEAPWLGIGRGAFEPSFTRVYPDAGFSTFSHAENAYIQAVVDWGVPGALAIGAALVWFWIVAIRRWRDGPLTAGALGALAVVAIQSNVDFGIELLAIAVPITAIAATVAYVPLREPRARLLQAARGARIAHVLGLGVAALLLLSSATTTILEDHAALDEQSSRAEINAAVERHPLDYYGFAMAAQERARAGDPAAIRLLNHALRLHPTHPGLHRMAARILYRDGYPSQAALEYAEAIRASRNPEKLIAEAVTLFPSAQAATALPVDYPHPASMVRMLDELGRAEVAVAWLLRVRAHRPGDARACELIYAIGLREKDLKAIESANRSCGEMPPDPPTRLALAQLLLPQRAYDEVIRVVGDVEQWTGHVETKRAAWLALCDAHVGLGAWEEAKRCLRRLDASGFVTTDNMGELTRRFETIEDLRKAAATATPPTPTPTPTTAPTPPKPTAPTTTPTPPAK